MTILGKILHGLGHFFTDLFTAYDAVWTKLEPEIQMVLVQGVGICEVIKTNLDTAPPEIFALIAQKYPQVTQEKLGEVINEIAAGIDTSIAVISGNPQQTLANIQKFLKTLQGDRWVNTLSTIAQLISMALGKGFGLNWSTVITLIEYCYVTFFKAKTA